MWLPCIKILCKYIEVQRAEFHRLLLCVRKGLLWLYQRVYFPLPVSLPTNPYFCNKSCFFFSKINILASDCETGRALIFIFINTPSQFHFAVINLMIINDGLFCKTIVSFLFFSSIFSEVPHLFSVFSNIMIIIVMIFGDKWMNIVKTIIMKIKNKYS